MLTKVLYSENVHLITQNSHLIEEAVKLLRFSTNESLVLRIVKLIKQVH